MLCKIKRAKILAIFLSAVLSAQLATVAAGAVSDGETGSVLNGSSYSEYLTQYKDHFPAADIHISAKNSVQGNLTDDENESSVIVDGSNPSAIFRFQVSQSGFYNIALKYRPMESAGSDADIRLAFMVDGAYPYEELEDVSFSRTWVNSTDEFEKDKNGNELTPEQKQVYNKRLEWAENKLGLYSEPYAIYFEAGTHEITVKSVLGELTVNEIILADYDANVPDYKAYKASISDYENGDTEYTIEAENAFEKGDRTLVPTSDETNSGMSPANPDKRVLNSFGQGVWKSNGQWASWKVPEDVTEGNYVLRFRAKQNETVGSITYRKLYINGELPFKEAEKLAFAYNQAWQIVTAGGDTPYLIHLKAGDVITLKATTGPMAEPLNAIYDSVDMLNNIYQSIIMVTGATPDSERDYNIQKEIPDLLERLKSASTTLNSISDSISDIMGSNNPKIFFIKKFINLIDGFVENYRTIVPNLSTFKSYIESYAGEVYDFNSLPLELDTIMLMPQSGDLPNADSGFWNSFVFEIRRFISSFSSDYSVAEHNDKKLTVWCGLGRDQAQSIRQIINSYFVAENNIDVDFKLSTTSLTTAILAGCEPHISISVSQEVPVDLALRGQAMDITKYLNALPEEYFKQFSSVAFKPFTYEDKVYAMPITHDFQMMFYRTDIFERLGLEVPKTWDDFYEVMSELQKNNFMVGIRESSSDNAGISNGIIFFETLMLQTDESYLKDNLKEVNFESTGGKSAFLQWVKLYRDYGLDKDFDLASRFRSGEMPLMITNYSYYQTLATLAPEISSRWTIAPMPGTVNENGEINNTVSSSVSGIVILKKAEKENLADEAFKFVSWWAGEEAQLLYSNALESLQGVAGRPAVANKNTFLKLGWTETEKNVIMNQWNSADTIQQIPGTYIINRSLTNALRTSYGDSNIDPIRQLILQTRNINTELKRKAAEFDKNN